MSRTQWYVFSSVRAAALGVLVWAVGTWLDRATISTVGKWLIDFGAVTVAIGVLNTWLVRYETYLEDEKRRQRQ